LKIGRNYEEEEEEQEVLEETEKRKSNGCCSGNSQDSSPTLGSDTGVTGEFAFTCWSNFPVATTSGWAWEPDQVQKLLGSVQNKNTGPLVHSLKIS
jgi:hypothetical protein